jgi:succinyl-CoA synthetase alpha subunit
VSILVDRNTRVIAQGMTGRFGTYHTGLMMQYGTRIVAGVTPGKGGTEVHGVPIYDSLAEAQSVHLADATITFVPAPYTMDAVFEALDAGIRFIACVVEGVPVRDAMMICLRLRGTGAVMLGPNSPGIITPGQCAIGFMPGHIYRPGPVGIVSRSGTFSYLVADTLTKAGLGQSTCVGIGGDPITGVSFIEILERFEADPETEAIVIVGEIGRTAEEEAAEYVASHVSKPVVGIIAGRTAPEGKQMGHAGAIITRGMGSYRSKVQAFERAGIGVAMTPKDVARLVGEALAGRVR